MRMEEFDDEVPDHFYEAREQARQDGKPEWFLDQVTKATNLLGRHYVEECSELYPQVSDDTLEGLILGHDAVVRHTLEEVGGNENVAGLLLGLHGPPPIPVQIQLMLFRELAMRRSLDRFTAEDTELTL
jgi:hypothetical protein